MRSHTYRLFGVTAAALLLAAGTAGAQGKGHGKGEGDEHGNGKGRGHENAQVQERGDRDEHDGRDVRDGRDERDGRDLRTNGGVYNGRVNNGGVYQGRDRRDGDVYGNGRKVPPGLAKKPGQMPPGQYKKRYGTNDGASVLSDILNRRGYSVMRTQPYGNSEYVYYRTPDGRTQRAIVTPGTDRLGFSNVPTAIVREVLARLY